MQNFQAQGAPPPDPRASGGWGLCPQTPKTAPRNCEFLAMCCPRFALCIIVWRFVAFVLNIFSSPFSCKPYDVYYRCMLNCFLFEKFYLHYALCDFDSILLHYATLFIRQSIPVDHNQIFDVTFETPPTPH